MFDKTSDYCTWQFLHGRVFLLLQQLLPGGFSALVCTPGSLFPCYSGLMKETEEKEIIVTAWELYDAGLSGFERGMGFFGVSVFFRDGRKRVFRELDTPHIGKAGIWYALERSDSIDNDDEFSFLDTDGNFYCTTEDTEPEDSDREKLGAFVTLFRDEITAVSDGRMDIVTLWDILHASRCRCPRR